MIIQDTIQNNSKNTTSDIGEADSIGMGNKISQINTQKKETKPDNPKSHNQNYPSHILMRRNTSVITQDFF
jgi:hypothetical protein